MVTTNITTQTNRMLDVSINQNAFGLFASDFEGVEKLSGLYQFMVTVGVTEELSSSAILYQPIEVNVKQEQAITRCFKGLVSAIKQHPGNAAKERKISYYTLTFEPAFAWLQYQYSNQKFINKSALEILHQILNNHKLSLPKNLTSKAESKLPYLTQNNESDLDFFNRVCSIANINYCFDHTGAEPQLVLFDDQNAAVTQASTLNLSSGHHYAAQCTHWQAYYAAQPIRYQLDSYDYHHAPRCLHAEFTFVQSPLKLKKAPELTRYHYQDVYQDRETGQKYCLSHVQHDNSRSDLVTAKSNNSSLTLLTKVNFTSLNPLSASSLNGQAFLLSELYHKAHDHSHLSNPTETDTQAPPAQFYQNTFKLHSTLTPAKPLPPIWRADQVGLQPFKVSGSETGSPNLNTLGTVQPQFIWDASFNTNSDVYFIRYSQLSAGFERGSNLYARAGAYAFSLPVQGMPHNPLALGALPSKSTPLPFTDDFSPYTHGFRSQSQRLLAHKSSVLTWDDRPGKQQFTAASDVHISEVATQEKTLKIQSDYEHAVTGNQKLLISQGHYLLSSRQTITIEAGKCTLTISSGGISIQAPSVKLTP